MNNFIHRNFLFLLIVCYLLAAFFPGWGLSLQHLAFAQFTLPVLGAIPITAPSLMLSILLFNSGIGIQNKELHNLIEKPNALLTGLFANILVPVAFAFAVFTILQFWHSNEELQNILMGLALIVAMPIAGSASAWTQNANGNVSLSLGLIVCSTVLSPLTSPKIVSFFSTITTGDYSRDILQLAKHGTTSFLTTVVVAPVLLGMLVYRLAGEARLQKLRPQVKIINFIVLLLLNYCNASLVLPQVFHEHDLDLIAVICLITFALSATCFASGWWVAKLLKLNKADMASLMFSLGMSNNGTGLVLASLALPQHSAAMLPLIVCILMQQIIAALVDRFMFANGK